MSDPEAVRDFPDAGQRFQFCQSQASENEDHGGKELKDSENAKHKKKKNAYLETAAGVRLEIDPDSWQVIGAQSVKQDVNVESVMLEQISGGLLYAPMIQSVGVRFQDAKMATEAGLVMQAIPVTVGTHRGFRFTEEIVRSLVPMLEKGLNVVVHHKFEKPNDVVGRVIDVELQADGGLLVTAFLPNGPAADAVRSGHFFAVSLHSLVEVNPEDRGEVLNVAALVEMTLTDIPEDKGALIVSFKDSVMQVPLEIQLNKEDGENMEPEKTTSTEDETEVKEEVAVPQTVTTPDPPAPQNETPPPVAEANPNGDNVKMEKQPEPTDTASVALEDRVKQLEVALEKEKADRQLLVDDKLLQTVKLEVGGLIRDGSLPPAAEEPAKKLLITLSAEQMKNWTEIAKTLQTAPLGGAEALNAGLVPTNSKGQETASVALDLTKLDDNDLELMAYAESNRAFEIGGGMGLEAQRKHRQNPLMGAFPSVYDKQEGGN